MLAAATDRELAMVRAALCAWGVRCRARLPGWWTVGDGTVGVLRTGLGRVGLARLWQLVPEDRPVRLLLVGYSGGLADDATAGSVFAVRTALSDTRETDLSTTAAALAAVLPGLPQRRQMTSPDPVLTPTAKDQLRRRTGASVVDMETAYLAGWAAKAGVTFASLRVVLDDHLATVPEIAVRCVKPSGQTDWRGIAAAACRPCLWRPLRQLARHEAKAAATLRTALVQVLGNAASGFAVEDDRNRSSRPSGRVAVRPSARLDGDAGESR